ncbi:MB12A protein, partial [Steatornis caripensis]|nr:MB12A protein [Steatornis caripensis]
GPVVTDVQVLSERSPQPAGYTRAPEFPEPRKCRGRAKRLYVKLVPRDAAETAVFALKLSAKSKALPHHLKIGELGGFAVWCKKGAVPKPQPLSTGLRQLSLQPPASEQERPLPLVRFTRRLSEGVVAEQLLAFPKASLVLFPAMDGVPFTLHPRFESGLPSGSNAALTDLNVKSLADIEREYNYAFIVERTAAARLPPSVC